jgi:hypothetical protein
MTPKEKAKDLFLKFRQIPPFSPYTGIDDAEAKECALIAVDEIIQAMDNVMLPNPFKQYWSKVKKQIEKI